MTTDPTTTDLDVTALVPDMTGLAAALGVTATIDPATTLLAVTSDAEQRGRDETESERADLERQNIELGRTIRVEQAKLEAIARAVASYLGVESGSLEADVREVIDRAAAGEQRGAGRRPVRELVRAYHERFHPDQHEATPQTMPADLMAFRRMLHDEEVREVTEAWDAVDDPLMQRYPKSRAMRIAHLVHELADVAIVAYGTVTFLGLDLDDVIRVVLGAAMQKVPNPDPGGKAIKPPGYVPADAAVLDLVRTLDGSR